MSSSEKREKLKKLFQQCYKSNPDFFVRSPGRINLIGEHTDYNGGPVLPLAIDLELLGAFRCNESDKVRIFSHDLNEHAEFSLNDKQLTQKNFAKYAQGAALYLKNQGRNLQAKENYLRGFDAVLSSNIPVGAGLPSSAALTVCLLLAYHHINHIAINGFLLTAMAQAIENDYIGVNCGIMDPLIISLAKKDHALYYHCGTKEMQHIRLPDELCFLVMDTNTRRQLSNSAYNQRHSECLEAAKALKINYLAQAKTEEIRQLETLANGAILAKRAYHVITEAQRTQEMVAAIRANDLSRIGSLVSAGHRSLAEDFEVSSPALDYIVGLAQSSPHCLGARLMGAGFAGCAVAVTTSEMAPLLCADLLLKDSQQNRQQPQLYLCKAQAGAEILG